MNRIPDGAVLEEDVNEGPADVGAAEAVDEEVAGEAEELEVVGAGAEDGKPDGPLQVLKWDLSQSLMPKMTKKPNYGSNLLLKG